MFFAGFPTQDGWWHRFAILSTTCPVPSCQKSAKAWSGLSQSALAKVLGWDNGVASWLECKGTRACCFSLGVCVKPFSNHCRRYLCFIADRSSSRSSSSSYRSHRATWNTEIQWRETEPSAADHIPACRTDAEPASLIMWVQIHCLRVCQTHVFLHGTTWNNPAEGYVFKAVW